MTEFVFSPMPHASLAIGGQSACYAVRRIFCVGRNYAAHAAEMGGEVDRAAPWYFTKSPVHLAAAGGACAYPTGTSDYHHEVELAVALGPDATPYGYAVGLDMTRRDRQADAKAERRPWDVGKDVQDGAIIAPLRAGPLPDPAGKISLRVNGDMRQSAPLSDMVWSVDEIIAHLSGLYTLGAGDLIMTGTPAGVGPVVIGDHVDAEVDGLPPLSVSFVAT